MKNFFPFNSVSDSDLASLASDKRFTDKVKLYIFASLRSIQKPYFLDLLFNYDNFFLCEFNELHQFLLL